MEQIMTSYISREVKVHKAFDTTFIQLQPETWVIGDKVLQHVLFHKSLEIFQGFDLLWSGVDCSYKLFYNSDLDLAQRQEKGWKREKKKERDTGIGNTEGSVPKPSHLPCCLRSKAAY